MHRAEPRGGRAELSIADDEIGADELKYRLMKAHEMAQVLGCAPL